MKEPKKMGAPVIHVDPERIPRIAEAFALVFSMRRAAGLVRCSPYHLKVWMKRGEHDVRMNINSDYSHLFLSVAEQLSYKAQQYLTKLEKCPDNAHCLTWLLERCMRADYGQDSDESKELAELYTQLLQSVKKILNQTPGAQNHVQLDIESDQEARSFEEGAGCQEG